MNASNGGRGAGLRAIALMAAWRRAVSAHTALSTGMACACGSPFDGVSGEALEQDLVFYVYDKYRGVPVLHPLFEQAGCLDGSACDLATLLRAVASAPEGLAEVHGLLDDLEKAISGFGRL